MPFVWNPNPQLPQLVPPPVVSPTAVTSEVNVVANTVNVGGELSYNTPNVGYDVVYEIESLNVRNLMTQNGTFVTAIIGTATINTANINQATINTTNITNSTIQFGYMTGNVSTNLSMATKEYVDNAIASISGGSGPDTTANLITTKGDLLVGFAPNTAHRLGVGSNGQVLAAFGNSNLKMRWVDASGSQQVGGLHIGTHFHPTLKLSQVLLRHADAIVMSDGEVVTGWDNKVADITVSGAGGLDANSVEAANSWYEVWAIRNSSSNIKALLLHRMLDRVLDQQWPATLTQTATLRTGAVAFTSIFQRYCSKVSQSFVPLFTGDLKFVDLTLSRTGLPGGNVWISIQNEGGLGNASGSPLATSRTYGTDFLSTSSSVVRFVFDTAALVTTTARYHIVAEGDWTIEANGNSINFFGNTATLGPGQQSWMANVGYTSGNLTINSGYGDCRMFNVVTGSWITAANTLGPAGPQDLYFKTYVEENDTALALPAGYNQKCLISYVHNNSSSNFKEYHQQNRTMVMGFDTDWLAFNSGATNSLVPVDLGVSVPAIACSVQFLCWTTNLPFGSSFAFHIGNRYMLDMQLVPYADYYHRGQFVFGPNQGKMGLSPIIAMDDGQFIVFRQIDINYRLYVANITF